MQSTSSLTLSRLADWCLTPQDILAGNYTDKDTGNMAPITCL